MGWQDAPIVGETKTPAWASAPVVGSTAPKPLTNDNPNPIDNFLIDKLSKAKGIGAVGDIQSSVPGRVIQGMADLPIGAMQLGANLVGLGDPVNKRLQEMNQQYEAVRGKDAGFDAARLVGNLASPVALAALAKVPLAATRMGKIGQGAAIGGAMGATAPVTDGGDSFAAEKGGQVAGGALIGGAIPAVVPLVATPAKAAYHGLVEPWANSAAIKGRAFLEAAGDKADDIIKYLRENKQLVPGSAPTAGEAAVPAGSAEFSALQRSAANIKPSDYVARTDAQNAARLGALRTVGQDEAALTAAEAARKAASDPLYKAARKGASVVDASDVMRTLNKTLMTNPGNRELVTELMNVRKGLLDAKGNLRTNPQEISSVVDGLKSSIANKDNAFIKGALIEIKDKLSSAIPGYEKAQQVFSEMSKPVNQMQVGQYLEGKLIPALSEDAKQKAATYAGALADAPGTIKRATGAPRYDELTKILTPDQMGVVNSIRDDLARGARFESLAQKGAKAAPDISGTAGGHNLPNFLNRGVMVANALISRLEGKVSKKLASEMAMEMLDPPKVSDTLAKAKAHAARNKLLARHIERSVRDATALGIGAGERK